ncbi:hypothetical protein [Bacillus subtilis]|uniref:Uncharacterized protein n=2 Tax=Bacillus subtilis TaxID=1423 RepID=A0AAP1H995_BACIU|nr:hypothetical protein [Bacillus subtilis]AMR46884.1 hypothetical protein KHRBS_10650 [Bacillus subtilis subsp. subtilis]KIN51877.1 hypothetical protein B4146_2205 [Bacillus subtilis]KZD93348.1 hypothetical protein B4122_1180 [Bacillus subtilis]MBG8575238.1 hypothetical protein [Bacillus subtilis]MBG9627843.1 hypothetical protein [Bacillus subtilis]
MTSEEARNYFVQKGLSYEDITEGDICALVMLLNKHVKQAVKAHSMSVDTMRMSQKIKSNYKTNGTLKSCYLYINSHYFTQREAISFNPDGFIGFAGWADSGNTQPLIDAFIEWVDYMSEQQRQIS